MSTTPLIKIISLHPQYTVNKTLQGTTLALRGFKVKYEVSTDKGFVVTGECDWPRHPADIKEITEHVKKLIQQLK